jgi:hypothetical protein
MAANDQPKQPLTSRAVLLDAEVILAFCLWNTHRTTLRHLKIAAFTCDEFMVTRATLARCFHTVAQNQVNVTGTSAELNQVHQRVAKRLADLHVRVVDEDKVLRRSSRERAEKLTRELKDQAPDVDNHVLNDEVKLILVSESIVAPILTYSRKHRLASAVPINCAQLSLPFPVDRAVLHALTFDEIFNMAASLRDLYLRAFQELHNARLRMQNADPADPRALEDARLTSDRADLVRDLLAQIQDLRDSDRFWREMARPDAGATIKWTVADVALGFLGVPVPTGPLSYYLSMTNYKKLEAPRRSR